MATLQQMAPLNLYRARRARRLRQRAFAIVVAALALATMAYGESWLLEQAPRAATLECAVATGVAQALESPIAAN
jgi:hypothetical protein